MQPFCQCCNLVDFNLGGTNIHDQRSDQASENAENSDEHGDENESKEFIQGVRDAVVKSEKVERKHAHSMFVGPPGSGKSSLMDGLLGRRRRKGHSPSTGVCNPVVIIDIDIDNPSTFRSVIVSDPKAWKEEEYDVSLLKQMNEGGDMSSLPEIVKPMLFEGPTMSQTLTTASSVPGTSSEQMLNDFSSRVCDASHVGEMINAVMKKCGGYRKFKRYLKKSYSLYLRDTGGQVEFQEMIAVLIYGPSIFFFVFRLDRDFQSKFIIKYRVSESESTNRYTSSITTEEALLQCLASVFAMDTSSGKVGVKTHKPLVFVVGTHKDKLGPSADKKIIELNKHIDGLLLRSGFQGLVLYADKGKCQVMFTVDNTSESDEDLAVIRSKVHRLICGREEFTIEYPMSYLLFCLELENIKCSVLSLDECTSIAAKYGIVGDQVSHLLQFLHLRVGIIQYFDEDGLRHIVVKEPQVLFNRVTNLIIRTFSCEALTTIEQKDFEKGIVTASVFKNVVGKEGGISCKEFLKLLVHLRIITPYPSTNPGDQEERYFIPCVLNHVQESRGEDLHTNILALCVKFECKHCPKGLFGVLVTHLMTPVPHEESDSHTSFTLIQDKIFKDQVSFEVHSTGVCDEMSLKAYPSHLEVLFFPEISEDRDTSIEEVCSNVRRVLETSISRSLVNLHYNKDIVKPVMCLRCDHCSEPHPVGKGKQLYKIHCKKHRRTGCIPSGGMCWYSESE